MPALMFKIAHDAASADRRACAPACPPACQAFFERALAKDPADRHASGAEFAEALRRLNTPGRD